MQPKESPKELWLLGGIGILAVVVVASLLWFQKNNIDIFAAQINSLKQPINTLPATVVPKDKIALQIDQLTLEKDRISAQNAIVGSAVQAIGAGFFFISAYLTWRSLKVAEENLRATQEKQATERLIAEANLKATEEKQVTERFSKAIELLGSEKLEVRLGGIYALERIAKDSPKDHWTIMEVLTCFVQEKSQKRHIPNTKITLDIQSALTVIGRRDSSKDPEYRSLDLSNTNLQEANLSRANLSGANLGEANLSRANLSRANLFRTELFKAKLEHAHLIKTTLSESNLAQASLRKANLLNTNLHEAILTYADFSMSLNLTPEQVKSTQGWEEAIYDEDFFKKLGLPTESGDEKQNS